MYGWEEEMAMVVEEAVVAATEAATEAVEVAVEVVVTMVVEDMVSKTSASQTHTRPRTCSGWVRIRLYSMSGRTEPLRLYCPYRIRNTGMEFCATRFYVHPLQTKQ